MRLAGLVPGESADQVIHEPFIPGPIEDKRPVDLHRFDGIAEDVIPSEVSPDDCRVGENDAGA